MAHGFTRIRSLVLVLCSALLWSCSNDSGIYAIPTGSPSTRADLTLTPRAVTLGFIGDTLSLDAEVTTTSGSALSGLDYLWTSTDPSVASVDESGTVTAVGEGTTQIIARLLSIADTVTVTVLRVPVSLRVEPDSVVFLELGETHQVSAAVLDGGGRELSDSTVHWSSADPSVATVDSNGVITAVGAGETTVTARSGEASASIYVRVAAPPGRAYEIEVRYVGVPPTAAQQAAFAGAANRWSQVVVGDVPDVPLDIPAGACSIDHPAVHETVDDLLIFAEVDSIDGVGNILGQATPCYIRSGTSLTVLGIMQFDEADLESIEADGSLTAVITHEMGHVLGFGSSPPWTSTLVGAGTEDPYWPGPTAVNEFRAAGGTDSHAVPVANTGGKGTRDAHWREATLGRELMTGYLSAGQNPLSAITIGALSDMGYEVSLAAADPYTVSAALRRQPPAPPLHLREMAQIHPREVAPDGRILPPR